MAPRLTQTLRMEGDAFAAKAPRPRRTRRRFAPKGFDGQSPSRLDRPIAGQLVGRSRYRGDVKIAPAYERRAIVLSVDGVGPERTYLVQYCSSQGRETVTDHMLMHDFGWRNLGAVTETLRIQVFAEAAAEHGAALDALADAALAPPAPQEISEGGGEEVGDCYRL